MRSAANLVLITARTVLRLALLAAVAGAFLSISSDRGSGTSAAEAFRIRALVGRA